MYINNKFGVIFNLLDQFHFILDFFIWPVLGQTRPNQPELKVNGPKLQPWSEMKGTISAVQVFSKKKAFNLINTTWRGNVRGFCPRAWGLPTFVKIICKVIVEVVSLDKLFLSIIHEENKHINTFVKHYMVWENTKMIVVLWVPLTWYKYWMELKKYIEENQG